MTTDREKGVLARLSELEGELALHKGLHKSAVAKATKLHSENAELRQAVQEGHILLDRAKTDLMKAASALLSIAADCHRNKWEFEDDCQEAFDILHRIGDKAKGESDKLR